MKKSVKASLAGITAVGALAATQAAAQMDPAQQAIDVRQSVMTLISWNMGPLFGMARGGPYDAEQVQLSADRLAALSPMVVDAFAMDTSDSSIESEALPSIWESHEAFNEQAEALVAAVAQLKDAADAGDEDGAKQAIGAVGQACGACHDDYRVD